MADLRLSQLESQVEALHRKAQELNKAGLTENATAAYKEMAALDDELLHLVMSSPVTAHPEVQQQQARLYPDYHKLHRPGRSVAAVCGTASAPVGRKPLPASQATRALGAVLGCVLGDAAAMGVHWVYDLTSLHQLERDALAAGKLNAKGRQAGRQTDNMRVRILLIWGCCWVISLVGCGALLQRSLAACKCTIILTGRDSMHSASVLKRWSSNHTAHCAALKQSQEIETQRTWRNSTPLSASQTHQPWELQSCSLHARLIVTWTPSRLCPRRRPPGHVALAPGPASPDLTPALQGVAAWSSWTPPAPPSTPTPQAGPPPMGSRRWCS